MIECGCGEVAEEGFDPGHNHGCGYVAAEDCHQRFCSENCFDNENERGAQREYEDFHAGDYSHYAGKAALEKAMKGVGRW